MHAKGHSLCRSNVEALITRVSCSPAHAAHPPSVEVSQSTRPGPTALINQTLAHGARVVDVSAGRTGGDAAAGCEGVAGDGVVAG
jgi:hypothetical protein